MTTKDIVSSQQGGLCLWPSFCLYGHKSAPADFNLIYLQIYTTQEVYTKLGTVSKNQPSTITEFDETLVSRLIAKITVFDDHFTVDFKSGITINIEA